MKNARHNEEPEIPTLVVVFVYIAHMWRVMQPETEDQAQYDDFFRDTFGLIFGGGAVIYRRKCRCKTQTPVRVRVPKVMNLT